MNSTWSSRQQAYPRRSETQSNYIEQDYEEETDESCSEEARTQKRDTCHPGRSFEWPLEEECEYEEDYWPEEEDCDPSECLEPTDYYDDPYQTSTEEALGDSELSDFTSFDCPAGFESEGKRFDLTGRRGFVPDCVSNQRQLNDAIRRVNAFTTLDEFMAEVAPLTEDHGTAMKELMTAEVASFREFVKNIYKTRIQHMEDQSEEDFLRLQEKYNKKIVNLNTKITSGIRAIERVIPDFSYDEYKNHGYAYIYDKLEEAQKNEPNEEEDKKFAHDQMGRDIRATLHKAKWFSKEARRLERKNDKATHLMNTMYKNLASISDKLALSNNRLHTYNIQLEKYACCLKSQICRNQELLDHLLQVSGGAGATTCKTVRPEDVVEDCTMSYDCR